MDYMTNFTISFASSYEEAVRVERAHGPNSFRDRVLRVSISLHVAAGNLLLVILQRLLFRLLDPKNPGIKEICVYTVGTLGDNVLMLPAFAAIRQNYPGARITALTNCDGFSAYPASEILGKSPYIDRHLTLSGHPVQRRGKKLVLEFPDRGDFACDLFINLSPFGNRGRTGAVIRELIFAKWIGAKWAIGFRLASYNPKWRFNRLQHYFVVNEARRPGKILAPLGIIPVEYEDLLPHDHQAKDMVLAILAKHSAPEQPVFILNPGAKLKASHWPAQRFGEVAACLAATYRACVLVNGTSDEVDICNEVVRASGGVAVSLAGMLSIQELIELLRLSAACITNNTGPMTLSAMVGIPQIVMSSTRFSPTFYMPLSKKMIWLFCFTQDSYSYDDDVDRSEDLANIETSHVMKAVTALIPSDQG